MKGGILRFLQVRVRVRVRGGNVWLGQGGCKIARWCLYDVSFRIPFSFFRGGRDYECIEKFYIHP